MNIELFSGEKFQDLADIFIGKKEDLEWNPIMGAKKEKHLYFENIPEEYDNPKLIYTFTFSVEELFKYFPRFKNNFILITHNCDENIVEKHIQIAEYPLLIHWFTQNLCIEHPKISILPIGIANSMWKHGDMNKIKENGLFNTEKVELVYFNFEVNTNKAARELCKNTLLGKGLNFLQSVPYENYLQIISLHKFAICPEGNGIDSHRIWDVLYCGTIPVMLKNIFTLQVQKNYPCVLLDIWDDLNLEKLDSFYNTNLFTDEVKYKLSLQYYKNKIINFCSCKYNQKN